MYTKQIGFVGIKSANDEVTSITNGPTLASPKTITELAAAGLGYSWDGEYLIVDVPATAPQQILNFVGLSPITSVDFFGGRPPKIN